MRTLETVTLHFDLSHLAQLGPDQEFTLKALGQRRVLTPHDNTSRRHHAGQNLALAALSDDQLGRLTHYVADVDLPADAVGFHWVGYPSQRPGAVADEIAVVFQHVPAAAIRRAVRAMRRDGVLEAPDLLRHYGVTDLDAALGDGATLEDLHVHASLTVNYVKTALTMIMQHPEIGTLAPELHYRIGQQLVVRQPAFTQLWQYLSTHPADGSNPWYQNTYAMDPTGAVMSPDPNLVDKDGKPVVWPTANIGGQQVKVIPQHKLSADLDQVLTPTVQQVGVVVKQQPWLKGQQWTTQHGVTQLARTGVPPTAAPLMASAATVTGAAQADWTVVNKTSHYGLDLDQNSIVFDAKTGTLTFDVKNWPNRGLGAYVQFLDTDDNPIPNPSGWTDRLGSLPDGLRRWLEPNDTKWYLQSIGAGSVFFGAPVWAAQTPIAFTVPSDAAGANVLVGGLGNGNWDLDVDKVGLIYTCVAAYGIPSVLSILSVGVQSTQWYMEFFDKTENIIALLAVGFGPFAAAIGTGSVTLGAAPTLIMAAQFVSGIIFSTGLSQLALKITGYVSAMELAENAPFVGWALRVAGQASAIAGMLATSIEVGLSPATYQLQAKRSMTLNVTVSPDPTHGTPTQKPIWPATSDHYVITVQYKGGTTLTKTGPMPAITDQPISVSYATATGDPLPSAPGQQFQIIAMIYSASSWICGKWTSGWIEAVPTDGDTRTEAGSIIEQLVPLSPSTTYSPHAQLDYDGPSKSYRWQPTTSAPSGTIASLSGQDVQGLVDISINTLAYKLGYTYLAQHQNLPLDYGSTGQSTAMYVFESVSTLADPADGMLVPTRGMSVQPYLAYDQFGPAGLFDLQPAATYQPELDRGGPVSADVAAAFSAAGFGLPDGAQVSVVTASAAWQIGVPGQLARFDLRRQLDMVVVFNAPAPVFSPNNFYLDTRTYATDGLYHLRLVDLADGGNTTFDYGATLSWGAFLLPNISAITVHPNGYVIAISYTNDKMAILQLPPTGVTDADAPVALPFSGAGVREGLMQGPVGMTLSADGRILVLERTNARIQAFDTQANPVQCFASPLAFPLPASLVGDLDSQTASTALLQALQAAVPVLNTSPGAYDPRYLLTPMFSMPEDFVTVLDAGKITSGLQDQFSQSALTLDAGATILTTAANLWLIHDSVSGVSYDVRFDGEQLGAVDVYRCFTPTILVKASGSAWTILDKTNTLSFEVTAPAAGSSASDLHCQNLSSLMALKGGPSSQITYLDLAIETKGFLYVLSYTGDGSSATDYRLDLYNPDGTPLQPNVAVHNGQVNAGRLTVDQWRTLFTLDYQQIQGAAGRPEPAVTQWVPSTPSTSGARA
jgi:hypothetical protein